MKKKLFLGFVPILLLFSGLLYSQIQSIALNGNNIKSYITNTGVFDQKRGSDSAGFEWPKGSGKFTMYSAGFNIGGYMNGLRLMSSASYKGEYFPGYCIGGVPHTNSNFHIFKVSRGDNMTSNPDWANWGQMVPYGAPFVDVNHNGTYEPAVDTPGVSGAIQTIYVCLTDGFNSLHTSNEGFGGGTTPFFAELHMTAWCYNNTLLQDVQFIKWVIINKASSAWDSTIFSIFCDADVGDPYNDFIGVDSSRKLGFCYNAANNDPVYGTAPPAVGITIIKGAIRYGFPPINLGLSSFNFLSNPNNWTIQCETDPYGNVHGAYFNMMGYKNDSSCWINPLLLSGTRKTVFCFPGDPETRTGWTELDGSYSNCNSDSVSELSMPNGPGDRRFLLNSGKVKLNPGDSQTIVIAQVIAQGTNNLNSVTKLKILSDTANAFYNRSFIVINKTPAEVLPDKFSLYQNYPNPFNPATTIKFNIPADTKGRISDVKLIIYDILGKEVTQLVNDKLQAGIYEVSFDGSNIPSGVYFYKITAGNYVDTKKMLLIK